MKSLSLNSNKIEALIYSLIWLVVFSVPYFNESMFGEMSWDIIFSQWARLAGFLAVFLINAYILIPKLLFNKKYTHYVITISFIIFIGIGSNFVFRFEQVPLQHNPQDVEQAQYKPFHHNSNEPRKPPLMVFVDNLVVFILILGAGTSSKLVSKWLSEEKLRKDIEKEQLKTNLALLRHQVSPHFFMNTLNNIHSLIEIDSEKAQDAIERLSTLMRYLLYDSAQSTIELRKEIDFIHSFVSLMRLRYSDEVEVTILISADIADAKIPPMLFISLIENAFKHGVDYPHKSFIHFELQCDENSLFCIVKNSKRKIAANCKSEYSGIGLDNIKESLKLLYNDNFMFNIFDRESEFEVNLKIPL